MRLRLKSLYTPMFLTTLFVMFLCLPLSHAASGEKASAFPILKSLNHKFYVIGETTGDNSAYLLALETAREELAHLLNHRDYDLVNDLDQEGANVLHLAALNGYYPLVEIILADKRGNELLNQQDTFGFTPLDYAKLRTGITRPFHTPIYEPMIYIPYIVNLGWYLSDNNPYEKTIAVLEKYNPTKKLNLKDIFIQFLSKKIETFEESLQYMDLSNMEIQDYHEMLRILQKRLKFCHDSGGNDSPFLESIVSQIKNSSPDLKKLWDAKGEIN